MSVTGAKGKDHPAFFDLCQDRRGCLAVLRLICLDLLRIPSTFSRYSLAYVIFYSILPAINQARSAVISSEAPFGIGDMILS